MSANASDNKDAAALGVRLQSLTLFLPEVQGAPADNGMSFSPPRAHEKVTGAARLYPGVRIG